MNRRLAVYWQEKQGAVWEHQADFNTECEAYDYISEQPMGSHYNVVKEYKEENQ